jgi:hypothetical protein
MKRSVSAFVVGLVLWVLIASILNRVLRAWLDGYAPAEQQMAFTLPMMAARLVVGALASLAAGAGAGAIALPKSYAPWVLGGILVAAFIPGHVQIWDRFPVWHHLTFLFTLAPLVAIGATLARTLHSGRLVR